MAEAEAEATVAEAEDVVASWSYDAPTASEFNTKMAEFPAASPITSGDATQPMTAGVKLVTPASRAPKRKSMSLERSEPLLCRSD